MNLHEIAEKLNLESLTSKAPAGAARPVSAAYASDLLSDVLAHAPRGGVLVTVQVHMNVITVSVHAELAGVIFASARRPDESVIQKATDEGIALYVSGESTFDVAGKLYALGLRGPHE